jgi:hypothetical protein
MEATGADLLSGYAGQILKSFGERVTVPLIFFLTGFLIPMFLNKIVKLGYFSLAVGLYIAVKKDIFIKIPLPQNLEKDTETQIENLLSAKKYKAIDELVYELYDLNVDEIEFIENK